MPAIKNRAKKHLQNMVDGAAKEVSSAKVRQSSQSLSSQVAKKILTQLESKSKTIQTVPIEMIEIRENIRRQYDEESLLHLSHSLKRDGLIQFPTLCLKKQGQQWKLLCRNGHRRILAAQKLGWEKIDCVIMKFNSAVEEIYHLINANMREDVFYLDTAYAYSKAHELGESDSQIADRVGVNPRTISWYRRLTKISKECDDIIRRNPTLFNATWAINLARKGPLPEPTTLLSWLTQMVSQGRTFLEPPQPVRQGAEAKDGTESIKAYFRGRDGKQKADWTKQLLALLSEAGLLPKKTQQRIYLELFPSGRLKSKSKGSDLTP